jgi:hypothetical protein
MATKTLKTLPTDNLELVNQCAVSLNLMRESFAKAEAFREDANVRIVALHSAKVVIGRYGKCLLATAFKDALIGGGLAKGTADNYLSTFRGAVESGKPVADWNPNRKGKGKGAKGSAKGSKGFDELMAACFNHDGGKTLKTFCEQWQSMYDDDAPGSFHECIADYLRSEGYDLAE